ncbi:MAG: flagellar hook-length control protein FliK [Nitrospinaceae bacterium]
MVPQADITLILSQPPDAGRPDSGSRSEAGNTRFQDVMENAVRGASRRETPNAAAASAEQNTVRREEDPAGPEDRSPNLDSRVTGPTPGGPADSPPSADSGAAAIENSIRQLDQLGVLNLHRNQIDALLGLLEGGAGTDLQALLQSLAQSLNLTATQQNQVAEFFKQAGLTEQQARNLLANLQNAQTGNAPVGVAQNLSDPAAVSAEGASSVAAKGASSVAAKGDGVSRLAQPSQAGTPQERLSPMETILSQAENQSGSSPENQNQNNGPQGFKMKDLLPDSRNLINPPLTENQSPFSSPLKGTEGLKTPVDVRVESLTAVSNPAPKSVEGGAPVQLETIISRGPGESRVMEQILNKVIFRSNGSRNEIRIRLEPPSLGTVRMNITTSGDSVRTVIVADNHTVKQIIENNFTQLRDSLNGQGLKVDDFTVLVGGNSAQNGGSYSQPGEQTGFGGFGDYQDPLLSETRTDEARPPAGIRMIYGDSQTISVFA